MEDVKVSSNSGKNTEESKSAKFWFLYIFSVFAFGIFVYTFFFSNSEVHKNQSIYWFFASMISAMLPHISHFKFKDIEVDFKKEIKKVGEDITKKTEEMKTALSADLKDAFLPLSLQQLYQRQREFHTMISSNPLEAGKINHEALEFAEKIQPLFPKDTQLKMMHGYLLKDRAIVMQRMKKDDEFSKSLGQAKEKFEAVLEESPYDASALNGMGSIYYYENNLNKALEYINKALAIDPNFEAAKHDRRVIEQMMKK